MEDRTLLSVDVNLLIDGMSYTDSRIDPPDTHGAVGPDHFVETVNTSVAFFDKDTGERLGFQTLQSLFAPVYHGIILVDPVTAYLEQAGRFVVAALEFVSPTQAFIDVAVSDDADPTHGFSKVVQINASDTDATFPDYPKIGWNADALVISINQTGSSRYTRLYTIDVTTLLDPDPADLTVYKVVPPPRTHFTLAPATMHGAKPGEPMWLVEHAPSGAAITVVRMDNVLSEAPTFTITDISVPPYYAPPRATQPEGGTIYTGILGPVIMNAAYRDGRLVATQTVGGDGVARVRWYEFDTTGPGPALTQMGEINQGAGVHTYFPSIEIDGAGDLGLTFMQSSPTEYVSMFVSGQSVNDPRGTMQDPMGTHPGRGRYDFDRAGDYSGISVDPTDDTFWAANEYRGDAPWNTGLANFGVSAGARGVSALSAVVAAVPAVTRQPAADLWAEDRSLPLSIERSYESSPTAQERGDIAWACFHGLWDRVCTFGVFGAGNHGTRDADEADNCGLKTMSFF